MLSDSSIRYQVSIKGRVEEGQEEQLHSPSTFTYGSGGGKMWRRKQEDSDTRQSTQSLLQRIFWVVLTLYFMSDLTWIKPAAECNSREAEAASESRLRPTITNDIILFCPESKPASNPPAAADTRSCSNYNRDSEVNIRCRLTIRSSPCSFSTSAHMWPSVWSLAPPVLTHKSRSGSSFRVILITPQWGTMSSWSSRVAPCTLVTVLSEGLLSQPRRGVASHVTSPCAQAELILVSQRAPPPSREAAALAIH